MRESKNNSRVHSLLKGILFVVAAIAIAAFVIHFAWNMVMPDLAGVAKMSYKNAFGLVILLGALGFVIEKSLKRRHLRLSSKAKVKNANA